MKSRSRRRVGRTRSAFNSPMVSRAGQPHGPGLAVSRTGSRSCARRSWCTQRRWTKCRDGSAGRWCKIVTLGLGSATVGRIGPLPRSPDDRCPTRPMNRAGTRSPGRATRSATGQSTTGRCSSGAVSRSKSRPRRSRLGICPGLARGGARAATRTWRSRRGTC